MWVVISNLMMHLIQHYQDFSAGIMAVEGKRVPVMDAASSADRIPFYTGANTNVCRIIRVYF